MAYILTDGSTTVVSYPYNIGLLRRDNPNVSFPANPTAEVLADWNVFEVQSTAQPSFDVYTQTVSEGTPTTSDGGATWVQTWDVIELTVEQQASTLAAFEVSAAQESGALLDQADQYVVTALARGKALSEEFAAYRQSLVDYQTLAGYPAATQWPTLPSTIIVDTGVAPISYPLAGALFDSGDVTFDSETLEDVTSIVIPKEAANAYDINTALDELKTTGNEAVLELNNLSDNSKKAAFKVKSISYTPPTQEQIDAAPYILTVSYLGGSANFSLSDAQVANLNYGRVSRNEKVWNSPNDTTWRIVDVHGARRVFYQPPTQISNNSYSYLGSSPTNNSSTGSQTQTIETDVSYVTVSQDVLSWLQGVNIQGQEIIVNGTIATMTGGYSQGGTGPVIININEVISYNAGDSVLINGVTYQPTSQIQIPDDGSIVPSTIVPYKSQIYYNGETRFVTGFSQGDFGLGPAFLIYFDGNSISFPPNNSIELSLWNPEVVNKWIDPEVDFGISPNELRGFSIDYHLYSEDAGTLIGKFITAIDDNPRVSHMYAASGASDVSAIDLETYSNDWYDDKAFVFKRTDDEDDIIMIQWSGKAFYSPEWRD